MVNCMWNDKIELESIENLYSYLVQAEKKYSKNIAIKIHNAKEDINISYCQLLIKVNRFGKNLIKHNITEQNIGVLGKFSYEWIVSFFGILYANNTVVPVEDFQDFNDIMGVLKKADVSTLVLSKEYMDQYWNYLSKYDEIYTICMEEDENYKESNFDDIDNIIHKKCHRSAMIVFTSGTSGDHKGVMLSHSNIISNIICCIDIMGEKVFSSNDSIVPLLPPFHMLQVTTGFLTPIYYGVSICFYDLKYLQETLRLYQPSVLIVVPVIMEGMYKQIIARAKKNKQYQKLRMATILSKLLLLFKIDIRKRIFDDIHQFFGGKIKMIVCGGAELDNTLISTFADWGISVLQGYGMTECSPVIACNKEGKKRQNSVGKIVSKRYCEVCIKEGEILAKGSIVFKDYYNDSHATRESFENNWFKTGDTGYIDKDGFLYVTGRKKNIIVLSDGNNVSPEKIEKELEKSLFISKTLVYAQKVNNHTILAAIVQPELYYCREKNIQDVLELIKKEIQIVNKRFPTYMHIQKVKINEDSFEITKLGKIKRYKYK